MKVKALTRYVRMSPQKVREVARQIHGLSATQAVAMLAMVPRKSARLVEKTLKSAIANAENNNNLKAANLYVVEAVAGAGPTLKRFTPKARGSAGPILKRSCHITVVLSDKSDQ